jgi:Flp pilus assembly protein CpaB
MVPLRRIWRLVDDRAHRHRRIIAAALTALAVVAGLRVLQPTPPATVTVVTAAHDLRAGTVLGPLDLRRTRVPQSLVPHGTPTSTTALVGRTVATPQRAGTPLTDLSVVRPALATRYGPRLLAAPVRIADPAAVALVRPGDRVTVFAATGRTTSYAAVVVADAPVITVPPTGDPTVSGSSVTPDGAVVVLAVTTDQASALTGAAARAPLAIALDGSH